MAIFETLAETGHQRLIYLSLPAVQLKGIIAIDNLTLGPPLAGLRIHPYAHEDDACKDALLLSQKLSWSASLLGCDFGGAAVVLWGGDEVKEERTLRIFGRWLESNLHNLTLTLELGSSTREFLEISRERSLGMEPLVFNGVQVESSYITALGIFNSIKQLLMGNLGYKKLDQLTFAIQGLGKIGSALVHILKQEASQVKLVVTDLNFDRIKTMQDQYPDIVFIKPEDFLNHPAEVLIPCAYGTVLNDQNINSLRCKLIAGSSYSIITEEHVAELLHRKGILLAPDFLINGGKLILNQFARRQLSYEAALKNISVITGKLGEIIAQSKLYNISPYKVAKNLSLQRIIALEQISGIRF